LTDDRDDWRARLKGTAPSRAKRNGLVRNAAILLGSRHVAEAVGPLAARLDDRHEDPVIRAAVAWSLARLGGDEATTTLARHRDDPDPTVRVAVRTAEGGPPTSIDPTAGDPESTGDEQNRPARIGEHAGRDG
jgi:HEAT repeat protein